MEKEMKQNQNASQMRNAQLLATKCKELRKRLNKTMVTDTCGSRKGQVILHVEFEGGGRHPNGNMNR